jgi:sigma-B regulation protein RsbU (phosphoserine phosphatase)
MTWSNAGHVKPFLLRANPVSVETLDTTGMPLGLLDIAEFAVETKQLQPGDRLIAYSDGLTEAQNDQGEFYGTARLRRLLAEKAHLPADQLQAAIKADVETFVGDAAQSDDVTSLILEYQP